MLSLSHNFLFVHVPKTAGTAIAEALVPYALPETRTLWRSITRRLPIVERPETAYLRQHETAARTRRKLSPEVYDRFFSFGVVRNPYDHAISHYEFMKTYRHRRFARKVESMSFADYLRWRMEPKGWFEKEFVRLPDQTHYLCDVDGRILVTRVLRHERMAEDWPALTRDLGLPHLPLKRRRESPRADRGQSPGPYYDDEARALVDTLYRRDFEIFGYARKLP